MCNFKPVVRRKTLFVLVVLPYDMNEYYIKLLSVFEHPKEARKI